MLIIGRIMFLCTVFGKKWHPRMHALFHVLDLNNTSRTLESREPRRSCRTANNSTPVG